MIQLLTNASQADEEFNIEKLRLVQQEKKKIAVLFERREKQIEIQKKMCVVADAPPHRYLCIPPVSHSFVY